MTKPELIENLTKVHEDFLETVALLSERDFLSSPEGKWTAGQQLEHIRRSTAPVKTALRLPRIFPRILFGTANRESGSYDTVVAKYRKKLSEGGRATGRFVPPSVKFENRSAISQNITDTISALCRLIDATTEEDLDRHLLPHPILGKLTFREMLMFTIYHAGHHHAALKSNLENR